MIDPKARDLIIAAEVSSKAIYEKKYQRPEWPGGGSGVTVAIGYDLGMASAKKIRADWTPHVSPTMLDVMASCAGVAGARAKTLCAKVRSSILIPWDVAIQVFDEVDVPEWERTVVRHIPKAKDLDPIRLGVLVSLAYNRGASFDKDGDRYREMRAIKKAVQAGDLDAVPGQLRSMKRLWDKQTMRGLHVRREDEAKLWESAK
jgi:hypothetical protein